MKEITVEWLEEKGACEPKIKRFKSLFGERAKVSYGNAEVWRKVNRYWRQDFDWLFYTVVQPTPKSQNVLMKLAKHLKIDLYGHNFVSRWIVNDVLERLKPQRYLYAITQIVYMVK